MKTVVFVMLQVILASGILYGYYHLMLRNKKFHQYNRFYLLAAVIISVLIPFLNIPVYFEETEIQSSVVLQTLQTITSSNPEIEVAATPAVVSTAVSTPFNWNVVLYFFYWFAASLLFMRILVSLKKIVAIIKNNPVEELNGVRFINTTEPGTPYSFFRWLFWNKKIELQSEKGEQIFRHEIFHIQQKHSLDIIFMELLTVVFWINPFFHLMKKELKAIHEFLADQFAAHKTEKWEYAELLLMQALNTQQHLVNPFFHNQIKRRIAMITNPKKTSHRYLRKLLVLPVAAIVLILFAFKYKNKTVADAMRSDEPITIVIDAGHGGIDAGVKSKDGKYTEAQLTLQIAKKIGELGKEYNVKVWMTRQDNNLPGNAATIKDGLKKRIEICEQATPFVFISIHMNTDERSNTNSGFEAAITGKKEIPASALLASAFLQNISSVYKVNDKPVKMPEGSVFVLDKNLYPAVLLQCGYISNAEDLAFITKEENQEKLARSILETIVKYKKQITGEANFDSGKDTLPKVYAKTIFPPPVKHSPSAGQLQTWTNAKMYGVWIDDKRIDNAKLSGYMPSDFALYYVSKLEKNAVNYGKHYYQIDLTTHGHYNQVHPKWTYVSEVLPTDITQPLIVIDGKEQPGLTIAGLDKIISVNDIIFINILKEKVAIAKYSDRGKAGVIEIKTKKKATTFSENNQSVSNESTVFDKVEIEPAFPGGELAWKKILETTLDASIPRQNHAPAGEYTVYIQFIVHTDGSISDIKALTNHGFGMEEEAKRIIKNSPKWIPAIQNGRSVNAYRKLPVNFVVGKGKNQKTTMIEKWLPEIVLVGYASSNSSQHIVSSGTIQSLSAAEGGSAEWRKFFERNLDPYAPISEGWAAGAYTIIIQFTQNEDGTLSEIKALTFQDSKTAENCINIVKHVKKMLAQKNNSGSQKAYFVQPFTFQVIQEKEVSSNQRSLPKISVSDLRNATIFKLLNIEERTEVVSYTFTIDTDSDIREIHNFGHTFNTETINQINNVRAGRLITLEDIRIKIDGQEKKIPSRVYEITD
jgi:N-acetylmuramoyl-L-alanine amidase